MNAQLHKAGQMKLQIEHAAKLKQLSDERKKSEDEVRIKQSEFSQAQQVYNRSLAAAGGSEPSAFVNKQAADEKVGRLEATIKHYQEIDKKIDDAQKEVKQKTAEHGPNAVDTVKAYEILMDLQRQKQALDAEYHRAKSELPAAERAKIQFDTLWEDLAKAKDTLQNINQQITEALAKQRDLAASQNETIRAENSSFGLKGVSITARARTNSMARICHAIGVAWRQWIGCARTMPRLRSISISRTKRADSH